MLQKFLWSGEPNVGLDVPLSVYDVAATATHYYFADANKNIGQLMDSSGNAVAKYEYSPFGVPTSSTGAYAATNPFCFSSEYYDSETRLVYYNYRYYSPVLGRWLSRDPIEEEGGYNLYWFIDNNPVYKWDKLGLNPVPSGMPLGMYPNCCPKGRDMVFNPARWAVCVGVITLLSWGKVSLTVSTLHCRADCTSYNCTYKECEEEDTSVQTTEQAFERAAGLDYY